MSAAYLQRLFDRAAAAVAAAAPHVSPSGASLSPVAAADQRLNEPGFPAFFDFAAPEGLGAEGDEGAEAGLPETPEAARGRRTHPAPPARAAAADLLPQEAQPAAPPTSLVEGPPPPAAVAPPFPTVGQVRTEDFVPPDADEEGEPQGRRVAPPPPPEPPAAEARAAKPDGEPGHARPEREVAHAVAPPPPGPEPRSPASPGVEVGRDVAAPPTPASNENVEGSHEEASPAPVVMMPPRRSPEPLPPPAPREEAPAPREEAGVAKPRPQTVRQEVKVEVPASDKPAAKRPMTAAEASLIGPLTPEPRARALFGLRRR